MRVARRVMAVKDFMAPMVFVEVEVEVEVELWLAFMWGVRFERIRS